MEIYLFCGEEGPCASVRLYLMAWNLLCWRGFIGLSGFICFCFRQCVTLSNLYFFAGRGCDANVTLGREDSTLCFDCLPVFIFFFLCWPLGPYIMGEGVPCAFELFFSAAGPPAGDKIFTLSLTHPPPSHRQLNIFCAPSR